MDEFVKLFLVSLLLFTSAMAIHKSKTLYQILGSVLLIIFTTYVITYNY